MLIVLQSGSLNLLEPSGPIQACNGIALPFLYYLIHSLVFSLEGWAWQEPEPSHVTGMALAQGILGKFLGVVCHCFPPPLDVPILASVRNDTRDPSSEWWPICSSLTSYM